MEIAATDLYNMNVKHEYKEFNQTRDYYKKISETALAYLELDKGPGSNEGSYEAAEKTVAPEEKGSDQEEPADPETQSSNVSSEEEDEQTESEADDPQTGPIEIEDLGTDTSEKDDLEEFYTPGTSCLLYTSPSPRDLSTSRMPSSA